MTMTQITLFDDDKIIGQSDHHPLSPSSMARREICPYSFLAEHGIVDTSNPASERGTKLHDACEKNKFDHLDEDDRQQCMWAVEQIVNICGEYKVLEAHKEIRLSIRDNENKVITFGTSDVLLVVEKVDGERHVVVVDYKFGYCPVSVSNNIQLQCYGVGACQKFNAISCDYYIVQPALEYCACETFEDVSVPLKRIIDVDTACHSEHPVAKPDSIACKYCKARHDCEFRNEIQAEVVVASRNDISAWTPSEVAIMMDKVGVFKGIIKDMENQVFDYCQANGRNIDGKYKIIKTKGKSKAITVEQAYRIAPEHTIRKYATVSKTALAKAYVEANYVKGENTKKSLNDAFKVRVSPLLTYSEGYDKLIKTGGK